LTIPNITAIYKRYTEGIPQSVVDAECERWQVDVSPKKFENLIMFLNARMNYLDKKYFNL
jgi:hypothetical protein